MVSQLCWCVCELWTLTHNHAEATILDFHWHPILYKGLQVCQANKSARNVFLTKIIWGFSCINFSTLGGGEIVRMRWWITHNIIYYIVSPMLHNVLYLDGSSVVSCRLVWQDFSVWIVSVMLILLEIGPLKQVSPVDNVCNPSTEILLLFPFSMMSLSNLQM